MRIMAGHTEEEATRTTRAPRTNVSRGRSDTEEAVTYTTHAPRTDIARDENSRVTTKTSLFMARGEECNFVTREEGCVLGHTKKKTPWKQRRCGAQRGEDINFSHLDNFSPRAYYCPRAA